MTGWVLGDKRDGRLVRVGLILVTFVALGLRLWKANWSLPYVPHPDEPAIMNVVLAMLRNGDPNPHFFYYPSFWIYVQAAVSWLHLRWGMAQGLYVSAADLPLTTDIATSVPGFFTWGRAATALVGVATVPAIYVVARNLGGHLAGLLAAALLAFNTFHVINSHYITTDVASELFVTLTLIWSLRIATRGQWRDYLVAGIMAGLAASAKHNGTLVATAIIAAHIIYYRQRLLHTLPRLVAAGATMIGFFLLSSPFIVLTFDEFRRDLLHQLGDYAIGLHGDIAGRWPVGYYITFFGERAVGWAGCALAFWGTYVLSHRGDKRVVVLWVLVLAYVLIFLSQGNHWMRNIIAAQIPLFALAGVGGADVLQRIGQSTRRNTLFVVGSALVIGLLLPSSVETAGYVRRLQRGDTRVQALRWIETQVPPGVQVAGELKPVPGAGESRWTEVDYLPQRDLDWYQQQGYTYLVASSDAWRQLTIPDEYLKLAADSPIVEFGDDRRSMFGPRLVVYATNVAASDASEQLQGNVQFAGTWLVGATLGRLDPELPRVGVQASRVFKAGEVLGLRTFWQVEEAFNQDFFIFVHVLDATGNKAAQRDAPPWQGRFPTSSWQPGTLVVDNNDVLLPETLAPGDYSVVVGMFDPTTGSHPPLTIDGQLQSDAVVSLATITIEP